jgi:hypothetical protein
LHSPLLPSWQYGFLYKAPASAHSESDHISSLHFVIRLYRAAFHSHVLQILSRNNKILLFYLFYPTLRCPVRRRTTSAGLHNRKGSCSWDSSDRLHGALHLSLPFCRVQAGAYPCPKPRMP